MSNARVIETLQKKRVELEQEREKMWQEITATIYEIDATLADLLGELTPKEPVHVAIYDDETSDHIKGSIEN